MRKLAVFICLLPLLCRGAGVGPLPDQKTTLTVSEKDRNPFGVHQTIAAAVQEDTESEESQIRKIIAKLPVCGLAQGSLQIKALLGSMIIETGGTVPPVIPNQTEVLEVLSVAPNHIELGFREKDGTDHLRKIVLSPDLRPQVHYMLGSQSGAGAAEASADKSALGGVIKKNEPQNPAQ